MPEGKAPRGIAFLGPAYDAKCKASREMRGPAAVTECEAIWSGCLPTRRGM